MTFDEAKQLHLGAFDEEVAILRAILEDDLHTNEQSAQMKETKQRINDRIAAIFVLKNCLDAAKRA